MSYRGLPAAVGLDRDVFGVPPPTQLSTFEPTRFFRVRSQSTDKPTVPPIHVWHEPSEVPFPILKRLRRTKDAPPGPKPRKCSDCGARGVKLYRGWKGGAWCDACATHPTIPRDAAEGVEPEYVLWRASGNAKRGEGIGYDGALLPAESSRPKPRWFKAPSKKREVGFGVSSIVNRADLLLIIRRIAHENGGRCFGRASGQLGDGLALQYQHGIYRRQAQHDLFNTGDVLTNNKGVRLSERIDRYVPKLEITEAIGYVPPEHRIVDPNAESIALKAELIDENDRKLKSLLDDLSDRIFTAGNTSDRVFVERPKWIPAAFAPLEGSAKHWALAWSGIHMRKRWPQIDFEKMDCERSTRHAEIFRGVRDWNRARRITEAERERILASLPDCAPPLEPKQIVAYLAACVDEPPECEQCSRPIDMKQVERAVRSTHGRFTARFCGAEQCQRAADAQRKALDRRKEKIAEAQGFSVWLGRDFAVFGALAFARNLSVWRQSFIPSSEVADRKDWLETWRAEAERYSEHRLAANMHTPRVRVHNKAKWEEEHNGSGDPWHQPNQNRHSNNPRTYFYNNYMGRDSSSREECEFRAPPFLPHESRIVPTEITEALP